MNNRVQSNLEQAILEAVTYSDVFNYPLTPWEIHRYLPGLKASLAEVQECLKASDLLDRRLYSDQGYYYLAGRRSIVSVRQRRADRAARLWPAALRYGRQIASLPFVRMVAVTGALAMDNEYGRDIDYLVVTVPGRLWVCRALILALVRWTRLHRGETICPNYFLSTHALALSDQNLYTAHELAQMVPISGLPVYYAMLKANAWLLDYLPNTPYPPLDSMVQLEAAGHRSPWTLSSLAEALLRTAPGGWAENWEMRRKARKLYRLADSHWKVLSTMDQVDGEATLAIASMVNPEAEFSPDRCKGHLEAYEHRTLKQYMKRLANLRSLP